MTDTDDFTHGRARLATIVLLVATGLLFGLRLGDAAVVSEEVRWAEIAREMRASGDYLRPTINGTLYCDKPVGSYWLIVAASHLTGGVNEAAARLPSALAGVVGVWLVVWLATRLFDAPTGILAGAMLATSFGYAFYARRASADAETVAGVTAAVCWYVRNRDRGGRSWVVLLWVLMAATSLTKGLLGFALPLVVMAGDTISLAWGSPDRRAALVRHGRWLFNPWSILAVPLAASLYLLPFLLAADGSTGESLHMVWRENVRRFVAPHNHTGPVYLYAGVIFVLAAPWSLFLPAALVPSEAASPGDRFARLYFWAVFAFFTASASRRSYYLLPVLPAAALLIARVLLAPGAILSRTARGLRTAGRVGVWAFVALVPLAFVPPAWVLPHPYDTIPALPGRAALAVAWVLSVAALLYTHRGESWPTGVAVTAFGVLGYFFTVALPDLDAQRTRRTFLADVHDVVRDRPEQLALFHARDVVFDFGRPVPDYADAPALAAAMQDGRVRWVLARKRYLAGVVLPARVVAEEANRPWEGIEQLGDKAVLLESVTP